MLINYSDEFSFNDLPWVERRGTKLIWNGERSLKLHKFIAEI